MLYLEVDGRKRRCHIEGYAVLSGEDCHRVGPDLVGDVAVSRDPVRPHDYGVDEPLFHHIPGHTVGYERYVYLVLLKLPRGEPRPLEKRPRLIGVDPYLLFLLDGAPYDAEGRAVASGRKSPGVTVCKYGRAAFKELAAVFADKAVYLYIFLVDPKRLVNELLLEPGDPEGLAGIRYTLHPLYCPEEVHGGRPGRGDRGCYTAEFFFETLHVAGLYLQGPEGYSHRRGHPDGRSAPYHHILYRPRDLLIGLVPPVDLLFRQKPLVYHDD